MAGKPKRSNCPISCNCVCHDGFGGAHPNMKCRDSRMLEEYIMLQCEEIESDQRLNMYFNLRAD